MRISYGLEPSQFGQLSVPVGPGPWPVVVVIHGGFWRERFDLGLGEPLAADLVRRGLAAWNVEYRRVGNGGGWPNTLLDVAAAIDRLADLAGSAGPGGEQLDLGRVIALGHSAGGQLATWLAARPGLPEPFGPPVVPVAGVVSQAGVLDLETARADRLGDGAVEAFMAGADEADWSTASPIRQLPVGVPVVCVHGDADDSVPVGQSERFVAAARAAGDSAKSILVPGGDHFGVITPGDPGWAACAQAVEELAAAR